MDDFYGKTLLNIGGVIMLVPVKPVVAAVFAAGVAVGCGIYYLSTKATAKS